VGSLAGARAGATSSSPSGRGSRRGQTCRRCSGRATSARAPSTARRTSAPLRGNRAGRGGHRSGSLGSAFSSSSPASPRRHPRPPARSFESAFRLLLRGHGEQPRCRLMTNGSAATARHWANPPLAVTSSTPRVCDPASSGPCLRGRGHARVHSPRADLAAQDPLSRATAARLGGRPVSLRGRTYPRRPTGSTCRFSLHDHRARRDI